MVKALITDDPRPGHPAGPHAHAAVAARLPRRLRNRLTAAKTPSSGASAQNSLICTIADWFGLASAAAQRLPMRHCANPAEVQPGTDSAHSGPGGQAFELLLNATKQWNAHTPRQR
jgi:hypothetical protein